MKWAETNDKIFLSQYNYNFASRFALFDITPCNPRILAETHNPRFRFFVEPPPPPFINPPIPPHTLLCRIAYPMLLLSHVGVFRSVYSCITPNIAYIDQAKVIPVLIFLSPPPPRPPPKSTFPYSTHRHD